MAPTVVLRDSAKSDLKKLPKMIQLRILKKIQFFSIQTDPLSYAKKLQGTKVGTIYRWRVGTYRVLFIYSKSKIVVVNIEHRKDIYK